MVDFVGCFVDDLFSWYDWSVSGSSLICGLDYLLVQVLVCTVSPQRLGSARVPNLVV